MNASLSRIAHVFPDVASHIKAFHDITSTNRHADRSLREKIISEARYLEVALLQLRGLQNSCVGLICMPPEVLALIVDLLVMEWPAKGRDTVSLRGKASDIGWITLSHVCRQLRSVLLDRKDLWARTISTFPNARDDMLTRAGDQPLTLNLRSHLITSDDFDFALKHLVKARVLEIDETTCDRNRMAWTLEPAELSQIDLPLLEQLILHLQEARIEQFDLLTPDVWELPPPITPRLRKLVLHGMAIPFNPSTLTHLDLHFEETPAHLYSAAQFLDILRQCTRLRELILGYSIPVYPLILGQGGTPVDLPALERIYLDGDINVCLGFWNHISVPLLCTVQLHLNEIANHYPDFCSHIEIVPSQLDGSAFEAPIIGLSMWDAGEADPNDEEEPLIDDVSICWLMSEPGMVNNSWTGVFKHDYKERMSIYMYSVEVTTPYFMRLIAQALKVIDVSCIQVLELGSKLPYSTEQWSQAMRPFDDLHTLYLEDMPRTPLLLSLAPTTPDNTAFASVSLPALRFLWLEKLDLSESDDGGAPEGPNRVEFIRMLLARKQRGFPLEHLRIGELDMDAALAEKSFLPRLRAIVPLVECDSTFL